MAVIEKPGSSKLFTPADQAGKPEAEAISYSVKVPDYWDKIEYSRRIAARGARHHGMLALHGRARQVMALAYPEGQPDELIEIDGALHRLEKIMLDIAAILKVRPGPDADDAAKAAHDKSLIVTAAQLAELETGIAPFYDQVASLDDRFATMLSENSSYHAIVSGVAVAMFVTGWTNIPAPFKRSKLGLDDASLSALHLARPQDIPALKLFIDGLMRPTEAEAGNSVSPSTGSTGSSSSETEPTA